MEGKKLVRSKTNRMLFGVGGGLGEYFGIDPTIVRIIFVVLTIWGGVGIILYIIGIFLIPESSDGAKTDKNNKGKNKVIEERVNAVAAEIKEKFREEDHKMTTEQIFGLIILLIGLGFFFNIIFPFYNFWKLWPLVLVVIGIALLARSSNRKGSK